MKGLSGGFRFCAGMLAVFALLPSIAAAQDSVEGTMRIDDRSVPLTHVYARETRPSPDRDEGPKVLILMTDRPAPLEVIASSQAFYRATEAGTINGVLLMIEPPDSRPRVVIAPAGTGRSDTILPDPFERIAMRDFARAGGTASGRIVSAEPSFLVGGEPGTAEEASVDLRFRTSVAAAPQPSRVLAGDEARNSEQVAAAVRALQLIHTGNASEIRAQLYPDHPLGEQLEGPQAAQILRMAREMLPTPAAFVPSVQRVVLYGDDEAIIVARDAEGSSTVSLRRENGAWKMAQSPIPND